MLSLAVKKSLKTGLLIWSSLCTMLCHLVFRIRCAIKPIIAHFLAKISKHANDIDVIKNFLDKINKHANDTDIVETKLIYLKHKDLRYYVWVTRERLYLANKYSIYKSKVTVIERLTYYRDRPIKLVLYYLMRISVNCLTFLVILYRTFLPSRTDILSVLNRLDALIDSTREKKTPISINSLHLQYENLKVISTILLLRLKRSLVKVYLYINIFVDQSMKDLSIKIQEDYEVYNDYYEGGKIRKKKFVKKLSRREKLTNFIVETMTSPAIMSPELKKIILDKSIEIKTQITELIEFKQRVRLRLYMFKFKLIRWIKQESLRSILVFCARVIFLIHAFVYYVIVCNLVNGLIFILARLPMILRMILRKSSSFLISQLTTQNKAFVILLFIFFKTVKVTSIVYKVVNNFIIFLEKLIVYISQQVMACYQVIIRFKNQNFAKHEFTSKEYFLFFILYLSVPQEAIMYWLFYNCVLPLLALYILYWIVCLLNLLISPVWVYLQKTHWTLSRDILISTALKQTSFFVSKLFLIEVCVNQRSADCQIAKIITFQNSNIPVRYTSRGNQTTLIKVTTIFDSIFIKIIDLIFLFSSSTSLLKGKKLAQTTKIKIKQMKKKKFYQFHNKWSPISEQNLFLFGLCSVWKQLRFWVLPIAIVLLFFYYSFFLKSLPFLRVVFSYLLLVNAFYLLMSGFVFFFKKYQYRLYTSAIQRFWRRTLTIFWIIEGSLFAIFIYLIFNASQEHLQALDTSSIYKTHFYSWRYFFVKIIISSLIIILVYSLLLSVKWNTFTRSNNIAILVTSLLLYMVWLEFYQLHYLICCYNTTGWVYDFSEHFWSLDLEPKKTRLVNHFVTMALIAKFWHIIFAVIFWIFFLLRGLECSRYRYPLISANLQNFFIIYAMSWLYMYPWLKYTFRKFLDMPYYWFFINNRKLGTFLFITNVKLYFWGISDSLLNLVPQKHFKNLKFFYWDATSIYLSNTQFVGHYKRDLFLKSLKI